MEQASNENLGRLNGWHSHPLVAALLSVIWPGLGHLRHRNRRAWVLAVSTLAISVAFGVYILTRSRTTLLLWSVSPSYLWFTIGLSVAVLLFRIWVVLDAFRCAKLTYTPVQISLRRGLAMAAGVLITLVVLLAVPHFVTVRYAVAQLNLLYTVFDATDTVPASPTLIDPPPSTTNNNSELNPPVTRRETPTITEPPTTTVLSTVPTTSEPVSTQKEDPSNSGSSTPPQDTDANEEVLTSWDGEDRLTIALLGGDSGYDRSGVRTDTIILVSIDVATGDAAIFNVPRNWRGLTFPAGTAAANTWPDGHTGLANSISQ